MSKKLYPFIFIVLIFIGGCGVKGDPEPPKDVPSTFPKDYPTY